MQKNEVIFPMAELFSNHLPNVLMGLRSVDKIEAYPEATEEERKLEWFFNVVQHQNFNQSKTHYKKWLLLKGFEDIHKAISESLRLVLIYKTIKKEGSISDKQIDKIRRLHYPSLVEKTQKVYQTIFSHEKEMLSLNKIRNALSHDNGIALSSRLENGEDNLTLDGARPILYWQDNERRVPMKIGELSPTNTPLMMSAEKFQIEFDVGSNIELSLKQFIDVIWTCMFIKADIEVTLDSLVAVEPLSL